MRDAELILLIAACVLMLWGSAGESLQAQPARITFERLSEADGLPETTVSAIVQDDQGFLWFGTDNGLARYDGYGFTAYRPIDDTLHGLGGRVVRALATSATAHLWIGLGDAGLHRLDPTTGLFVPYPAAAPSQAITALYEAEDGRLWIGTPTGLHRFDPATGTAKGFPAGTPDAGADHVTALLPGAGGMLWVGTQAGLRHLDPATGADTRYRFLQARERDARNRVSSLQLDAGGAVWVGLLRGGLVHLNPATGRQTRFRRDPSDPGSLASNSVRAVFLDDAGALWVGHSGAGLSRRDPQTGRFTQHRFDPLAPRSLSGNTVAAIFQDHTGVLWFGMENGGLSRHDPRVGFKYYGYIPRAPGSLSAPIIRALEEDQAGVLWIGTRTGGLNRFDPTTGLFTHYRHDPADPGSLPSDRVLALHSDRDGFLWVGTFQSGLSRLDPATGRFTRYRHDPVDATTVAAGPVHTIHQDRHGHLWVGTVGGGLSRLDLQTERFTRFTADPYDPHTLSHDQITTLFESRDGTLWVGTLLGLNRYDAATGRFTVFADRSSGLDHITMLHEDAAGLLWVGTRNGGLHRFDPASGTTVRRYTMADGLPSNRVHSLLADDTGRLWLGTTRGLSRFDPTTEAFRNYHTDDGLYGEHFHRGSAVRSASGRFYFGGDHGLNVFSSEDIVDNPVPPRVALTAFRLSNQRVMPGTGGPLARPIGQAKRVTLRHDQDHVTLAYVGLHYSAPARVRYQTRLAPIEAAWQDQGTTREVTYINLDPGTYSFSVRAANKDGVWSEAGAPLTITVFPPWWQTTIFRLLMALLLLGAVYAGYQVRLRSLRAYSRDLEREVAAQTAEVQAQAARLEEMDRLKSRLFANVSHEFRTPLTLTIGPLEDLQQEAAGRLTARDTRKVGLALRNARRLLRLINQLLDVTKLEAGRMELRPQPGDFVAGVRGITTSFAALSERRGVALQFHTDAERLPGTFDPDMLEKVVSNLLSNAFKYTSPGGTVRVSVAADGPDAVIAVRDTGAGIAEAQLAHLFDRFYQVDGSTTRVQEGTGIGLALVKELVELHGGGVAVESAVGFGSTFTVRMARGSTAEVVPAAPRREDLSTPALPPEGTATGVSSDALADVTTASTAPEAADRTTVLVVDDNAEIRAYLREHLADDYAVLEAADGEAGLAAARAHLPDLILSDVMMPRLDGYGFCHAAKADPVLASIPFVLLTARAEATDKHEGLGEGADGYLVKPFDVHELRLRLRNLLAAQTRLRDRLLAEAAANGLAPALREVHASVPDVVSMDDDLLDRARRAVEAGMGTPGFGVEALAEAVGMSRVHLHRRLRDLTGQTPSAFMHALRMERAAQLLRARAGTVTEVAYAVGYKSLSHFSKTFQAHHGVLPSAYPEA